MGKHGSHAETGKGPWRVVFVVALVVLIASLVALGIIFYSYIQGQMKYGSIASDSGVKVEEVAEKQLEEVTVDWDALKASNPDTAGWLYVPNTSINYPVVHGEDNDYYLTHDFDGDAGWLANFGAIFMDYRNNPDWSDKLYFIYGHHMNDGSMFADLAGLTDQARFDECRTMYILTPQGNMKLRTFAMDHVEADAALVQQSFVKQSDMAAYMQDKIDQSVVNPGEIIDPKDMKKVVALATCDNMNTDGRYILYAYVEEASAEGLTGNLGLESNNGEVTGFIIGFNNNAPAEEAQ